MKRTQVCPKCQNEEIVFVPQIADRDDRDVVRPLAIFVRHFDWKEDEELGHLQAYVCRACGFTEFYALKPEEIPSKKVPGVKVLKGKKKESIKPSK